MDRLYERHRKIHCGQYISLGSSQWCDKYIHPSACHTLASVDTEEENVGPENRMVDELDCAIKTTCLNKNRQDTVLLDSIDVHKGHTYPDNSTPPNNSPSDDYMSKPAPVSSDNTLLGDCGVKTVKIETREQKDDYGWTEYVEYRKQVDCISVCEAHRVREEYIHPSAHHT